MSIPNDKYWVDLDGMKYEDIIGSSSWEDPLDQKHEQAELKEIEERATQQLTALLAKYEAQFS